MRLLSLLRRLWERSPAPPITHTLVCGASRSGKSEAELSRLAHIARRGDCAIVLLDPPGTLAAKLLLHLHALGLDTRVLYDRLADTDRVPGYDWLLPSLHSDPLQREAENDERIREFVSILLRRREIHDPAKTPVIEEGLLSALQLYISQDVPSPLPWLAEVFDRGSALREHLLTHCTDPRLVRKFQEYASLSPTARRTEVAPAERILRAVCTSPAFRVRSGGATFDLGQFLDGKGILILDGGSRGNLSQDAATLMMGAIILRVIQHCRTGSKSKVVLVLDEAVSARLIGIYESQALSTAGKWGLEFHILVQDPFGFPSEEIKSNVLQNCWRHEWFRQGSPEAARLAAEDIATPLLDPLKVHYTEQRIRMTDAGFQRLQTPSRSEWIDPRGERTRSRGWHTVFWPRRNEIKDTQDRYTTLTDQILLMQKELMVLKPGERFVRCDRVTSTPEYVPMLKDPSFALAERDSGRGIDPISRRAESGHEEILQKIKQRAAFRLPPGPLHPSHRAPISEGAASRLRGVARPE